MERARPSQELRQGEFKRLSWRVQRVNSKEHFVFLTRTKTVMLSLTFFGLGWKGVEHAEGTWIHLISESSHFELVGRKGASAIHLISLGDQSL